jgi:hypothetical protein
MSERRSVPTAGEIPLAFEPVAFVRLACGGVLFVRLGGIATKAGTAEAVSLFETVSPCQPKRRFGCFSPLAMHLSLMVFSLSPRHFSQRRGQIKIARAH